MIRMLFHGLLLFALVGASHAQSPLNTVQNQFMARELENDHFRTGAANTEISPDYMPGTEFDVPYLLIPEEALHTWQSGENRPALGSHLFDEDSPSSPRKVRFFIHPESLSLYEPLVQQYGIAGHYRARPTASTRTLMAWDPHHPERGTVFLKLSLNKRQYGLGRPVPDWEVRRSTLMSRLVAQIPQTELDANGLAFFPEPAGAYIDRAWGRGSYVDQKQRSVFQHGFILRDTDPIAQYTDEDREVMPLFALLQVPKSRKITPPLMALWQEEHAATGMDFNTFVRERFLAPIVRALGYLTFHQGIITEPHAQNMVVVLNRRTRTVERVILRDMGSFKAHFALRISRGLPVGDLITHNTSYDFKPQWAFELMARPIYSYFHSHAMQVYRSSLKDSGHDVSAINQGSIDHALKELVRIELRKYMPLPPEATADISDLNEHIRTDAWTERYLALHPPKFWQARLASLPPPWLQSQKALGQSMALPSSWCRDSGTFTDGGYVEPCSSPASTPTLVFPPREDLPDHGEPILHREVTLAVTSDVILHRNEQNKNAPVFVVRAGTAEHPRFWFLNSYDVFWTRGIPTPTVQEPISAKALILADFSGLPEDTQARMLSAMAVDMSEPYLAVETDLCEQFLESSR
jgi:hypothetical protein